MSLAQRWQEVREGFERPFWVANITELFERLSYYGVNAILAIYLHETLKFSQTDTGDLMGFFGGVVWFLPILGGTLADRFGFRRSLAAAYMIMAVGYFLLGSLSARWMAGFRESLPLYTVVLVLLAIPALGPAIVKPCVVGTTARASRENVRSLGYSIYYTLVNVGGTLGPLVAFAVRRTIGIEAVFLVCALSVFLMFFGVAAFYKEPRQAEEKQVATVAEAIGNLRTVMGERLFWLVLAAVALKAVSWGFGFGVPAWVWLALLAAALASLNRFMLFLVIFSGYWVVFWQEFIALPLYVRSYVNPEADIDLLLSIDPLMVICFQIPVSYLTRKIPSFAAMTLGTLVSSVSWLILGANASTAAVVASLVVLAAGEMIQSPRYYEYVSRLAPSGQQGVFMGFAFLPIAIGFVIAGSMGGRLLEYFAGAGAPHRTWWVIAGYGLATTLLMWIYDRVFKPGKGGKG